MSGKISPTVKPPTQPTLPEDHLLIDALRAGDEAMFAALVERYHGALVRTAMLYVRERDVAEEVVQEAWIGVLRGLEGFEGRSSLRTWIFRIVTFKARTRGEQERRSVPFSSLEGAGGPDVPSVDPGRFRPPGAMWEGGWAQPPTSWGSDAATRLLSRETQRVVAAALEELPDTQRTVMTLRDLQGFSSDEVCEVLQINPGNQRVLLHRARARVRTALEHYFAGVERG
jgi:RNA polymerase sigma-70 factor (ECF subfamily)